MEQYRLLGRLAVGGMAEIYIGLRREDGGAERPVAIKRARPELGSDLAVEEQLRREADLTQGLRHAHLVETLDLARLGGQLCVVMELVEGENLRGLLDALAARGEVLSPTLAAHLCREVAAGLACAHEHTDGKGRPRPIIHGDLTPSNVFVSHQGAVKLGDFGIAELSRGAPVTRQALQGKAGYLSPEQVRGEPVDPRSDLFSLGVVLYELLGGGRLFGEGEAALEAVAGFKLASLSEPPAVTPPLWEVLRRLLQPDPGRRYPTAFDVVEALGRAAGSVGTAEVRALFERAFPSWVSPLLRLLRQQAPPAPTPPPLVRVTPEELARVRASARPPSRPPPPPPEALLPSALPPTPALQAVRPQATAPLDLDARLRAELDGSARARPGGLNSALGPLLVSSGKLAAGALQALERQALGRPLEELLVEKGGVPELDVLGAVAAHTGMLLLRPEELAGLQPTLEVLRRLPRAWAERLGVLPLLATPTSLLLAMSEPEPARMLGTLRSVAGCADIRGVLAPAALLREAIARAYEAHGLRRQPLLGGA